MSLKDTKALQDALFAAADKVLIAHIRPKRKVSFNDKPLVQNDLPPPLQPILPPSDWPSVFQESIDKALNKAWSSATIKNYSSGVRAFLNFCHQHCIPDDAIFPASDFLLCAFIASIPDTFSASTIKNYISGLRAWHIRNGYSFTRSDRLNLIVKTSRPNSKAAATRPPVTVNMLKALAEKLDPTLPFDICVLACAFSCFWGLARLGELLPNNSSFDTAHPPYPKLSHLHTGPLQSFKLSLPWTKVSHWSGETLIISQQSGVVDPTTTLALHIAIDKLNPTDILFSYRTNSGTLQVMTKPEFLSTCNMIWRRTGFDYTTGHSFCIGGTTQFLLCGIAPDIIKKAGRWSSDSFLRYWRFDDYTVPAATSNQSQSTVPGLGGEPRLGSGWGLIQAGGLADPESDRPQGARQTGNPPCSHID